MLCFYIYIYMPCCLAMPCHAICGRHDAMPLLPPPRQFIWQRRDRLPRRLFLTACCCFGSAAACCRRRHFLFHFHYFVTVCTVCHYFHCFSCQLPSSAAAADFSISFIFMCQTRNPSSELQSCASCCTPPRHYLSMRRARYMFSSPLRRHMLLLDDLLFLDRSHAVYRLSVATPSLNMP